jgi:hypothetical protein
MEAKNKKIQALKPKNKKDRAIAPKITEEAAEWYSKMFQSLNAGATFVLDNFPSFYWHALSEMRGTFSRGELCMILDVLNGHGAVLLYMSHPGGAGQHLLLSISDSFALYPGNYEEAWEIPDAKDFMRRLSERSRWQLICLEIWAAGFWEQHETVTPDEYCKQLI